MGIQSLKNTNYSDSQIYQFLFFTYLSNIQKISINLRNANNKVQFKIHNKDRFTL